MDYGRLLIELKHQFSEAPQDSTLMNKLAIVLMENNRYDENDKELNEYEAKELIQHIEAEIAKLDKLLEDLKQNKKPNLKFQPYLVDECYLYGCYQHQNPDFD
jgi:uncharacterized protein YcbK (DUF882 family)